MDSLKITYFWSRLTMRIHVAAAAAAAAARLATYNRTTLVHCLSSEYCHSDSDRTDPWRVCCF